LKGQNKKVQLRLVTEKEIETAATERWQRKGKFWNSVNFLHLLYFLIPSLTFSLKFKYIGWYQLFLSSSSKTPVSTISLTDAQPHQIKKIKISSYPNSLIDQP
jgi:hypothetical protein